MWRRLWPAGGRVRTGCSVSPTWRPRRSSESTDAVIGSRTSSSQSATCAHAAPTVRSHHQHRRFGWLDTAVVKTSARRCADKAHTAALLPACQRLGARANAFTFEGRAHAGADRRGIIGIRFPADEHRPRQPTAAQVRRIVPRSPGVREGVERHPHMVSVRRRICRAESSVGGTRRRSRPALGGGQVKGTRPAKPGFGDRPLAGAATPHGSAGAGTINPTATSFVAAVEPAKEGARHPSAQRARRNLARDGREGEGSARTESVKQVER